MISITQHVSGDNFAHPQEHWTVFTACCTMHGRCCRLADCQPAASSVHCITQSSVPEDGRNDLPKHVELIEIINKPLFLHLVGCLFYSIGDARSH